MIGSSGLDAVRVILLRFNLARTLPATILVSICIQIVNLGSGVVLARALGPSARGDLAIAMLWGQLIAGLGALGVAEAVVYLTGRQPVRAARVLNSSLTLGILQSAVLVGIGWFVVVHVLVGKPSSVIGASLLYLWVIPLLFLATYPLSVLQGRLLLGSFNLARASVHVFYTAALIGLWLVQGVTIRSALVASLFATALALLLTHWLVITRLHFWPRLSAEFIRPLLAFGAKLHVGNVAAVAAQRVDLVALSLMAPATVIGNYVVATAIGIGAGLIPAAASMVLFPVFSTGSRDALSQSVARFLLVAGILTVVGGPLLILVLPWSLPYLFGHQYVSAVSISMILLSAYLIRGWNQMLSSILRGSGHPLIASAGEVIGFGVTAVLLIYTVPGSGAFGAALSVLLGAVSMLAWVGVQTFRKSQLTIRRMLRSWSADLARLMQLVREQGAARR